MNWYRVTLTDNWCKPSRWHGYVRGEAHTVEEIAVNNCPDSAMCAVSMVSSRPGLTTEDVMARLVNATSPNEAILEGGTVLRKSDIKPEPRQ